MIEAGEQDKFLKSLTTAAERAPGQIEALEMLVDFCRHTSDPFRLNSALGQLADAYADAGNFARAEELLQELVDRNKNDERLVERLNQLRARARRRSPLAEAGCVEAVDPVTMSASPCERRAGRTSLSRLRRLAIIEEQLDEETQRYVAQALTDVDLFSSYGLTQKATHLLENVLQRAPRHTPTLERLLDLYLGGGNERRTAETASLLEQIHRERNDTINADRFAELRAKIPESGGHCRGRIAHRAAGSGRQLPQRSAREEAQASTPPRRKIEVPVEAACASAPAVAPADAEFEIALTPVEPEASGRNSGRRCSRASRRPAEADLARRTAAVAATEEVDLSDEWEAMAQEVHGNRPQPSRRKLRRSEPEPAPEPMAANEPSPNPRLHPLPEPEARSKSMMSPSRG